MSDLRKDLPDETIQPGESLDFTAEQLLSELAGYFYQRRQPGDVTIEQIREYFGVGEDTARKKVSELLRKGVLEKHKVYGEGRGHPMTIYRRRK